MCSYGRLLEWHRIGPGRRGPTEPLRGWLALMAPLWIYHLCLNLTLQVDLTVLKRAYAAMQRRLITFWAERAEGLPLKTMDEALILASIVEKETGRDADRADVAAVFVNRLRIGMPLQTDPTVIFGMGAAFDGNLRKRDLLADTPYNTYTRGGLPPTPIALPSAASLRATVRPAKTRALYFVARSDGSGGSVFSETLDDHNRAVNQFQRGGKAPPQRAQ